MGLLVGDPEDPLHAVLIAIDATPAVVDEALELGCSALLAYHPPIFQPLRTLGPRDLAFRIARAKLAVYSPHTALDVAPLGTNDCLAEALGLRDARVLRPTTPQGLGLGRVGRLERALDRDAFIAHIKRALDIEHVLVAGEYARPIEHVAVAAGAGGSLIENVAQSEATAFVCGELGHHEALRAARSDVLAICTLHSHTERPALPSLAARLQRALGVPAHLSTRDKDAFRIV